MCWLGNPRGFAVCEAFASFLGADEWGFDNLVVERQVGWRQQGSSAPNPYARLRLVWASERKLDNLMWKEQVGGRKQGWS